ncbi:hypothetical protein NQ314_005174 [Rhamnusium bicolor]|uniref:Uncharacterized protein n=1 Tax=Rhamnusium bicolor TaxID=1586634 RepID=A0AAV8ZJV6_9CUCU|nr:hypothetical protein NQ314_005174 [Rhamnusium bicolor]
MGFQDTLGHIKSQTDAGTQSQAVLDLINRIIPDRASEFSVAVDSSLSSDGKDTFNVIISN